MRRVPAATALVLASTILAAVGPTPQASPSSALGAHPWKPIYRLRIDVSSHGGGVRLGIGGGHELVEAAVERGRAGHPSVERYFRGERAAFRGFPRRPLRMAGAGRAVFLVAVAPSREAPLMILGRTAGLARIRVDNLNRDDPVEVASEAARGWVRVSVASESVASRGPVPGTEPLPPSVYAFYYQWYDMDDWQGGKPIAEGNVNPIPYDSGDPVAIERHIAQARYAGIDGFIVSWLGSGTREDQNARTLMSLLPPDLRFALYIEIHYPPFLTMESLVDQLEYLMETYATHPSYLRHEGRPLIYVWSSIHVFKDHFEQWNPDYLKIWRQVLDELALRGHHPLLFGEGRPCWPRDYEVFTGMHTYMTNGESFTRRLNDRMSLVARAWAAIHGGPRRIYAATPIPGYDDRHIPGRPSYWHFPREDGALYRRQWASATEVGADQAIVISFNEWPETTNIEPNTGWGLSYLDLTRELASSFRASRA